METSSAPMTANRIEGETMKAQAGETATGILAACRGQGATKVGDTLYRFDINRRKHGRDGVMIFAHHFEPEKITGETSRSWLVEKYGRVTKISKDKLYEAGRSGWNGYQWYTRETMEEKIWENENRRRIIGAVEGADAPLLRKIDAILSEARSQNNGDRKRPLRR